jgi:DNA-binding transcriptional LysR family regulator
VFDSAHGEILELVESGTAAFGLTLQRPFGPGLQAEPVAREPFVLACAPGHPLARRDRVAWAELQGHPLVRISLPSGNSMVIDEAIGTLGEGLDWRYEAQRSAVALDMVRGGLGLTIVPRLSVRSDEGITTVPLDEPVVHRSLILVTRRGTELAADARWVRDQAVALLQARLAPA